MTNTSIIKGSIQDIVVRKKISLAEAMFDCEIAVLCDGSQSMEDMGRRGKRRFDVLVDELTMLQERNPGKVAVVSFSNSVGWCRDGRPILLSEGTDMLTALKFFKSFDDMKITLFLISDGEPTSDRKETLNCAATFQMPINTIYVGPENGSGQKFLEELSTLTGGQHNKAFHVERLAEKITYLLED